jgi:Uma2 family endonuclease
MLGHATLRASAERGQTMSMPALPPVTTLEELLALPEDGRRHELLDGVHAVTPSPGYRHQDIHANLFAAVRHALATRPDLKVLSSPAGGP